MYSLLQVQNNRQELGGRCLNILLEPPLRQLLTRKFAEWVAKILADELDLPPKTGPGDDWSSADINLFLVLCCVSDTKDSILTVGV